MFIIHHSDLSKSASHQIALNVRYHHQLGPLSVPGGGKHIEIDTSELDIVDEDGGEESSEHFSIVNHRTKI